MNFPNKLRATIGPVAAAPFELQRWRRLSSTKGMRGCAPPPERFFGSSIRPTPQPIKELVAVDALPGVTLRARARS